MGAARHETAVVGLDVARRGGASALTTTVVPYLTAGVALVGANALVLDTAGSPPPPQAEIRVVSEDVQLAGSLLNIPINLLIDLINIPYYEQQALDVEARAFLYSGPWAVTSPANVWGEDPADFARFYALAASMIPIPALSGLSTSTDWSVQQEEMISNNGFANQFAKFLAAEWTVDPNCTALKCVPNTPVSPITGIGGVDTSLWTLMMLLGKVDFPVISSVIKNFFKVGLQPLLGGYSFGEQPSYDGQIYDELGIKGTVLSEDGTTWLMPWSNTEFNIDPIGPFVNWFNHLTDDPANNPIKLPSLEDFGRTLQTFLAGLIVAFNPFTPGSSLCPGFCAYMSQDQASPAIVQFIENMWPGNKSLQAWLANYKAGTSNMPPDDYIDHNINLWRNAFFNMWSFGNPLMEDGNINYGGNPSNLARFFHDVWTSLGLTPPPLEVDSSYVKDAGLQGGVYALKGQEIPILLILESDLANRMQANAFVNGFGVVPGNTLDNTVNTIWWEPSNDVGAWSLSKTIGQDKTPTIFGYDKGALIASQWKRTFNENFDYSVDPASQVKPKFVLVGNTARPNGGFSTRIDLSDPYGAPYSIATPTTTAGAAPGEITTTDVAYQYDPLADLPTNLLNPISLLNALMGYVNHLSYPDLKQDASVDPKSVSLYQGTTGDTDYYLIPSKTVPLLYPVQAIPFIGNALADMLDPVTRALVETGYDRTINPGQPTAANFFYAPDPFKLLFSTIPTAILTGLDNGFEDVGLGRVFGTTRPNTTSSDGAYGIGGPSVDVNNQNLTTTSNNALLAAAKSVSTYQVESAATGDGGGSGSAGSTTGSTGSTGSTTGSTGSTGSTSGSTEGAGSTTGSTGTGSATGSTEGTGSATGSTGSTGSSTGSTSSTGSATGSTDGTDTGNDGSTGGSTGSTGSTTKGGTGTDDSSGDDTGSGTGSTGSGTGSTGSGSGSTGSGSGSTGSGSGSTGSGTGSTGSGSGSTSGSGGGSGTGGGSSDSGSGGSGS